MLGDELTEMYFSFVKVTLLLRGRVCGLLISVSLPLQFNLVSLDVAFTFFYFLSSISFGSFLFWLTIVVFPLIKVLVCFPSFNKLSMVVSVQGSLQKYNDEVGFLAIPWRERKVSLLSPAVYLYRTNESINESSLVAIGEKTWKILSKQVLHKCVDSCAWFLNQMNHIHNLRLDLEDFNELTWKVIISAENDSIRVLTTHKVCRIWCYVTKPELTLLERLVAWGLQISGFQRREILIRLPNVQP